MESTDLLSEKVLTPNYWETELSKIYSILMTKGLDILSAILVLIVGFFIIGKVAKGLRLAILRRTDDIAVAEFVEKTSRIVMKVMLFLSVATQVGIETTSFVAAIGAAGLAIGMALQGSLSNFAGGVLILIFKPFRVGDTIDAQGFSGEVVKIDILHTKLITGDNRLVVLPNGAVANSSIVNSTRQNTRRSEFLINIGYQYQIQEIREIILNTLLSDPRILKTPAPTVVVNALNDSSIQLLVRFWTENGKHSAALATALENVKTTFDEKGITIPSGPQKIELIGK